MKDKSYRDWIYITAAIAIALVVAFTLAHVPIDTGGSVIF